MQNSQIHEQVKDGFKSINLDSWLDRATLQESQARALRTTLVLTGITSWIILITSNYFSIVELMIVYVPSAIILTTINLFYSRKTAAWGHTAKEIQGYQLMIADKQLDEVNKIIPCDLLFEKIYAEKFSFLRMDDPSKTLCLVIGAGGLFLTLKAMGSWDKMYKMIHYIYGVIL